MLPWESLPILRNQEVYRMPSVGSIFTSLHRYGQEKLGKGSMVFPSIDPLDAYYLLNPSGDLSSTEVEFDKWFKDQNLEVTFLNIHFLCLSFARREEQKPRALLMVFLVNCRAYLTCALNACLRSQDCLAHCKCMLCNGLYR